MSNQGRTTRPGDLPPWLRRRASDKASGRAAGRVGAAVALLALGGAGGFFAAKRFDHPPLAVAAPPAPVCPPTPACADATGVGHIGAPRPHALNHDKRAKPTRAAALKPLPEKAELDDGARAAALRAFAEQKAPELRDCLPEPDRGPPIKLGAAFEIDSGGSVGVVQLLGAENSPKEVRRCYAKRLKRWRFPEDLLRGEEKLLVNFVL
jgi:hypothetical protein